MFYRHKSMQANSLNIPSYEDYGFFGPDSVVWKVFLHPASFTVGFQRTVITEMFEPFLLASVSDTAAVMSRPSIRYDRTLQYVSTVAFADSATVLKASSILYKIHSNIVGQEPISGLQYSANDPDAQLWIHLTQWHSVLLAYEIFGPGKLEEAEESQYWSECRRAAAFQTIDPDSVPRSRTEMRAYYQRMRPKMAATINTQTIVKHLLDAQATLLENMPAVLKPFAPLIQTTMRKAAIATLPHWMKDLGAIRHSPREDAMAITAMRVGLKAIEALSPSQQIQLIGVLSPSTAKVVTPIFLNIQPKQPQVLAPEECWENFSVPSPRAQYLKTLSNKKVALQQKAPKDPGSEHLLQFA